MLRRSTDWPAVDDGWIEWTGGECPVSDGARVQIKMRSGGKSSRPGCADHLRWEHNGWGSDIVAYKVSNGSQDQSDSADNTAPTLLDAAAKHMRDRAAQYDQPTGERSMGRAVSALNAVLGRQAITESEGWLLLQLLKDVRDRQRPAAHRDSLEDCIAYAALKAEARLNENPNT